LLGPWAGSCYNSGTIYIPSNAECLPVARRMNIRLKELGHTGNPILCSITVMGFFADDRKAQGYVRDEAALKKACLLGVNILKRAYAGSAGVDALTCGNDGALASAPVAECGAVNKLIATIKPIKGNAPKAVCVCDCFSVSRSLSRARSVSLSVSLCLSLSSPLSLSPPLPLSPSHTLARALSGIWRILGESLAAPAATVYLWCA